MQEATSLNQYDKLQSAGVIQSFEFAFELAWKTLKDYLEAQGEAVAFPRQVIKKSYATKLISEGDLWLEMLDNRNKLSHIYNDLQAQQALKLICDKYVGAIKQVYQLLENKL